MKGFDAVAAKVLLQYKQHLKEIFTVREYAV
jgi:hypothetical protein